MAAQAPEVAVHVVDHSRVHLHVAGEQLPGPVVEFVPGSDLVELLSVAGRQDRVGRDHAQLALALEALGPQHVPARGEAAAEPLDVGLGGLQRGVHRAVGEVHEERTGGMRRPKLVHHAQRLVGQVVGEVVAVGIVVDVDVVVVGAQPVGLVEVGEGVEDPVEAVEAPLQGPAGLGGTVAEVGVLGQVPLADDEGGPARAAEGLGDGHRVVTQLVGVAGEAGIGVGHGGHAGHVVVESGEQ